MLLWSTVATAFKITLQYLTPVQMVFYASCVSAIALLVISIAQGKLHLLPTYLKQRPLFYLGLGLINPLIYYLVLFKAYDLLPASQAQPLNYTWAIALTLLSGPFLGQKIRGRDWLACGIGYFGVVVIATQGNLLALHFTNPLGVGLALLSTTAVGQLLDNQYTQQWRSSGGVVTGILAVTALFRRFVRVQRWLWKFKLAGHSGG